MTGLDPSVQVSLITVLGPIALLLVGLFAEWARRKLKLIGEASEKAEQYALATREQVQNSHTTNLRDDLDLLHADVKEALRLILEHGDDLKRHGSEIGGLRADMRLERDERLHLSKRVDKVMLAIPTAN